MSALQKNILKSKLPYRPPASGRDNRKLNTRIRNYTPVKWDKYFETYKDVQVGEDSFRVYSSGSEGPVLVLLHGGGLSALGWSLFADCISKLITCRVIAVDQRGHGSTKTTNEVDLSAERMSKDISNIILELYKDEKEYPPIILMGHSMGGAIAVHTAHQDLIPSLIGMAVIDVVEGTAMEALSSMQSFLRGRPKSFESLEKAIEWCVRSGQIRNLESAKVSMPAQIINSETGVLAIEDIDIETTSSSENTYVRSGIELRGNITDPNQILEESDESDTSSPTTVFKPPTLDTVKKDKYKWRIDLSKTETHWPGWFQGLSHLFLESNVPKLLILAGIETLDREMTIGQMQGKFQMQVLPQSGHSVQEDVPDKLAEVIASFLVRFKFAEPTSEFHRPMPAC